MLIFKNIEIRPNASLRSFQTISNYITSKFGTVFKTFVQLIMLQTFGFDISIDHPHKHVIRATQFMRGLSVTWHSMSYTHCSVAPRELSQVAYFMATNSLYLTTFCLEMRSEIVAATCIYLAFKWSDFEVGLSTDGRVCCRLRFQFLAFFELIPGSKNSTQILQKFFV